MCGEQVPHVPPSTTPMPDALLLSPQVWCSLDLTLGPWLVLQVYICYSQILTGINVISCLHYSLLFSHFENTEEEAD